MLDILSRTKPSLFIARPWDAPFAELFDPIKTKLRKEWNINDGPLLIKEDENQADREMFIRRNKQLYGLIVSGIKESDVFIADVTNANANVMLELGIAIQLNKNVIIFTGQDRNRLPFDIQGFHAEKYDNSDDLCRKIEKPLALYLSIKSQKFDDPFPENVIKLPSGRLTGHRAIAQIELPKLIKNIKIRLEYKMINPSDEKDWLGIHLRSSASIQPSELVYVRSNDSLEIVSLPTPPGLSPSLSEEVKHSENAMSDGFTRFEVILEGNKLLAATSTKELYYELIQNESFGNIFLQANAHSLDPKLREDFEIEFRNLEIINIDTTTVA